MAGWPEDHTAALRELYDTGMVYSDIAVALNRRFGTAYSKAAVIGRGRIIGLPQRRSALTQKMVATIAPPRPKVERRGGLKTLPVVCEAVECGEGGGYTLLDLPHDGCRYPRGEGAGMRFCGVRRLAGLSYCATHLPITLSAEGREAFAAKRSVAA